MTRLDAPQTLSQLIHDAICHCRTLDRQQYLPTASEWHRTIRDPVNDEQFHCAACLAGAYAATELGKLTSPETVLAYDLNPFDEDSDRLLLDHGISDKYTLYRTMVSLNHVRRGEYMHAVCVFYDTNVIAVEQRFSREQLDVVKSLPEPACWLFRDWTEFDMHLDSLEPVLSKLAAIGL